MTDDKSTVKVDALYSAVGQRIDSTMGRYADVPTEDIEGLTEKLVELSKASKESTILDQFNLGKPITEKAFNKIKEQVDPAYVEVRTQRVPIDWNKDGTVSAWEEQKKYVNTQATKLKDMSGKNQLTAQIGNQLKDHDLRMRGHIASERVVQSIADAEKNAAKKVVLERKRAKLGVKSASLKEIYAAACVASGVDVKTPLPVTPTQ